MRRTTHFPLLSSSWKSSHHRVMESKPFCLVKALLEVDRFSIHELKRCDLIEKPRCKRGGGREFRDGRACWGESTMSNSRAKSRYMTSYQRTSTKTWRMKGGLLWPSVPGGNHVYNWVLCHVQVKNFIQYNSLTNFSMTVTWRLGLWLLA